MKKGFYLVISGPSGVGKDTIANELGGWISVSATSRPKREGDQEGVTYFFYSREEFEELIRQNEFLEYTEYNGNLYGSPSTPAKEHYEHGDLVIFVIEVNGAASIKKIFSNAKTVFLLPPNLTILKERLTNRGTEKPEEIERRMQIAKQEIEIGLRDYDYAVVNDTIEKTVATIKAIIEKEMRG